MKSFLLACACLLLCAYYSVAQQGCVAREYQQQEFSRDPSLKYQFESAELFTKKVLSRDASMVTYGASPGGLTIIKIPVIVHILYRTSDENISDEQVRSQIEVLNKEFRKIHADTSKIPVSFRSLAADCYLEFVLASVNPRGYATTGIVRKKTNAYSFGIEDNIKFSQSGGDDAWDSDKYLNIWVANLSAGIIGYSSVLGGPKEKDGIVVEVSAFGSTGKITMPYTKGRTAVHEIGHWLGLRHIWGDQYCGSDGVEDTPTQGIATRGCPSGKATVSYRESDPSSRSRPMTSGTPPPDASTSSRNARFARTAGLNDGSSGGTCVGATNRNAPAMVYLRGDGRAFAPACVARPGGQSRRAFTQCYSETPARFLR